MNTIISGSLEVRKSNRIYWIDIAKGLGIILVCLGHMEEITSPLWKQFAASFHMPLFFVISGILFYNRDFKSETFKKYLIREFNGIIKPYLLWGLIYANGVSIENILRVGWGNNKLFGSAGLWFLPVYFVANLIIYIFFSRNKSTNFILMLLVGLYISSFLLWKLGINNIISRIGYPFGFDIACCAAGFTCVGILYTKYNLNYKLNKFQAIAIICIFYLVTYIISQLNYPYVKGIGLGRVVMATTNYGNFVLFIVGGIIGSIATIGLSKIIKRSIILEFIGKNSLIFMVTNHFAIEIIMGFYNQLYDISSINHIIPHLILVLLTLLLVLIICSIFAIFINHTFPYLAGSERGNVNNNVKSH